ncbi:heme exporter protein CcmD [Devosia sp.]|uniref:heme exporter protein CcmD n=1 Tax=Devosia sp. TaxID=1871048 RepID=UPI002FCB7E81
MIDLGPHAVFIVWAYIGVAIAVAGLIGWTLYDARSTTRKLIELEARDPRRAAR